MTLRQRWMASLIAVLLLPPLLLLVAHTLGAGVVEEITLLLLLMVALLWVGWRAVDRTADTMEYLQQENWVAEQADAVGGALESVWDQKALALRTLKLLDGEFDIVCAAFYALPLSGGDTLHLVTSRNCPQALPAARSLAEKEIARCRDDHQVQVITPLAQSYRVQGVVAPAVVVMVPLVFEESLQAVIELTFPHPLDAQHLSLLQRLAEHIAGVLYGVRLTMRMEALLADADASRIELKEKADELERVSSYKSNFLASMSHEIRTPMNAILGMGELLGGTPLAQDQREYLSILRSSGDGLLRIINDILDISKIEAGELLLDLHPFDLLALVEHTSEMMAVHAHKKGLELLLHVDDGLPAQLQGDGGRIQQILINLMGNAIKFTEAGEVALHLHLQQRFTGGDGVTMCRLLLEVTDSGIGIAQDKIGLIFNLFTQADSSTTRRFGGTGLGLAISRQLVQKMGGELCVESKEGEGSCFTFTMALQVIGDALALPAPAISTDGRVMLVVDESAGCREQLAQLLSRWGVAVLQAANGSEALALLEARQGDAAAIDLLLASCDMQDMDGFALVAQVKQRFPEVAELLLMTTTEQMSNYKRRAQQMGVELMLTKPICPSALLNLLLDILQQQHAFDDGTVRLAEHGGQQAAPKSTVESRLLMPKIKVLIAEDDQANQVLISHIMQRWKIDYTVVDNGQEAVLLVQHQRFDLLLMDVNMPVMDGWEASRKIRAHELQQGDARHLPIVALTALAFAEDERKCLDAGMDLFLTKPIRQKVLRDMVWKMVDDGVITLLSDEIPDVTLPLFDHQRALDINDGDEALLALLVQALQEDLPQQLTAVGEAVARGACQQVRRSAHKLKGALGTLDIVAVRELAFVLEKAAVDGDDNRCRELFVQLQAMVQQLQQELATRG